MTEEKEEKLAGDELEKFLKEVGADKLAEAFKDVEDEDCGCDKRKVWLNEKHLQLKEWWKRVRNKAS